MYHYRKQADQTFNTSTDINSTYKGTSSAFGNTFVVYICVLYVCSSQKTTLFWRSGFALFPSLHLVSHFHHVPL